MNWTELKKKLAELQLNWTKINLAELNLTELKLI